MGGLRPVFPPGAPLAFVKLAERCWSVSPGDRSAEGLGVTWVEELYGSGSYAGLCIYGRFSSISMNNLMLTGRPETLLMHATVTPPPL